MNVKYIPGRRERRKRRVAAYCRVSTRRGEQEESLEFQREYYKTLIQSHGEWQFSGIYYDERSGLSAEKRTGFQRMIKAALNDEIDFILCKSISRFSRNIVDCQRYARLLGGNGVSVFFEKENMKTTDPSAEMMFALLGSIAQSESQSISDHVRVACQHRFERGEYNLGNNRILGYDSINGRLVPNGDAWIVRMIFQLFLEGNTYRQISAAVADAGGHRLFSKKAFTGSAIRTIIKNETYVGDKLLQKKPHKNFLSKRPDFTIPYQSFYLKADHEGVIDRDTWNRVQDILRNREEEKKEGIYRNGRAHHFLYGKVFCEKCGAPFTRRTFFSSKGPGDRKSYKAWSCKERQKGKRGNGCRNVIIREDRLLEWIGAELDWEVVEEKRFLDEVERVEIKEDGIFCKMIGAF